MNEGYVYFSYGDIKYLKFVVASAFSLKKFDEKRPIAIVCDKEHRKCIEKFNLLWLFDSVELLEPDHCSIVGFKHNLHKYLIFDKNLFLDSDIIWCKDPDPLWKTFSAYKYTVTGNLTSDVFFGSHKGIRIIKDILLNKRRKTLRKFGLTYLSRVQTGMVFAQDYQITKKVNDLARQYLSKIDQTHFKSRKDEVGRNEESCEWSLAMAMSKLQIPVTPWYWGQSSPQVVYVKEFVTHDEDFDNVICHYCTDLFVENLKGIRNKVLRESIRFLATLLPGKGDYIDMTPYCLHFGFYHEKEPLYKYADKIWNQLVQTDIYEQV